jgi:hypothetical protein
MTTTITPVYARHGETLHGAPQPAYATITPGLVTSRRWDNPKRWTCYHLASGRALCGLAVRTRAEAAAFAAALAGATDWEIGEADMVDTISRNDGILQAAVVKAYRDHQR